jgi:large subunit ribosomal protein L10
MALTRANKEELVGRYAEGLADAPHAFVLGFQGITVAQTDDLRRRIREQGGRYEVVKNRLALIAVKGKGLESLSDQFTGPTGVAFSNDDPVALAKALAQFSKDNPVLQFKGALVDGQAVAGDQVAAIATMPSREELIAKLLFLLQSPITRFVRGLNEISRQLVVVLDQVRRQKEGTPAS